MTLDDLTARHRAIALDSNALIYVLEAQELGKTVKSLLNMIEDGTTRGVLSSVGLAEVLVKPAQTGDAARFEALAAEIQSTLNLRIAVVDAEAAADAAWIRGQSGIGLTDALHLACARAAGATAFVTNDRRLPSRPGLEVIQLSELEAA